MQNSGTKLVVTLVGVALLLGGISWWYRYQAAHRVSQFWGSEASTLIAESDGFQIKVVGNTSVDEPSGDEVITLQGSQDLSNVRGQAHLRHALLSDRNIMWQDPVNIDEANFSWHLRFYENDREAWVFLARDFSAIGKRDPSTGRMVAYSCVPMATSLKQYFSALGLLKAASASTVSE